MELVNITAFDKLTAIQWDEKIFHRSAQVKFPQQLKYLIDEMYPAKIARLSERLKESRLDEEELEFLNAKILRLTDKYATCKKMLALREAKAVPITKEWAMHGTIYYIDLDGGDNGNDGLGTGTAWLTLEQYTTTTVRTAGDIAYVRANTDETVGVTIAFDEDGTVDASISIIGCDSVTNDPWSDSSDVRPIVDFNSGSYDLHLIGDHYWKLEKLDITSGRSAWGNVYSYATYDMHFKDCIFRDYSSASTRGAIYSLFAYSLKIENCDFYDNTPYSIYSANGNIIINNCTFNKGTTGLGGLFLYGGNNTIIENTSIGQTTAFSTYDIRTTRSGYIRLRNCIYNHIPTMAGLDYVLSEDDQQVKGAHKGYYYNGTITKDTGVVRSGGATSSAKVEPNSNCGLNLPLSLSPFNEHDFNIYCSAVETTITIYMRSFGVWSTYPTATELYVEASYLDHAADATRTKIASTAVLDDEATWQPFTVTFTPLQAGIVYVKLYLGKYEAGKGIYVDVYPVRTP